MKVGKLISDLRKVPLDTREATLKVYDLCIDAADRLANDQTHIAALQQEIEKLRSDRRWIPVTERMPDPFVSVIVCRDGAPGERIVEQGHRDVGDWWKVYGTRTKRVTHWMPLPESPEDIGGKEIADDSATV